MSRPVSAAPEKATSPAKRALPAAEQPDGSSWLFQLQDHLIGVLIHLLALIQYLLILLSKIVEKICNFLHKLYVVLKFAYHKPQHAKQLFNCTVRMLRVSYDAGLWNWADCYDLVARQTGKMIHQAAQKAEKEAPPPPPPLPPSEVKTAATSTPNVK